MIRVCFVCMGNICRSPIAEGITGRLLDEAGMRGEVDIDSAGLGNWHAGSKPDRRAIAAARAYGTKLDHRAWQFRSHHFGDFDLVLALDDEIRHDLERLAPDEDAAGRIRMLRDFDPDADDLSVQDPYYGTDADFLMVYEQCAAACAGLVEAIRSGEIA